jgi:hypothetical protein
MRCLHLQGKCSTDSHISLKRHGIVAQNAAGLDKLTVSVNKVRKRIIGSKRQESGVNEKNT